MNQFLIFVQIFFSIETTLNKIIFVFIILKKQTFIEFNAFRIYNRFRNEKKKISFTTKIIHLYDYSIVTIEFLISRQSSIRKNVKHSQKKLFTIIQLNQSLIRTNLKHLSKKLFTITQLN